MLMDLGMDEFFTNFLYYRVQFMSYSDFGVMVSFLAHASRLKSAFMCFSNELNLNRII